MVAKLEFLASNPADWTQKQSLPERFAQAGKLAAAPSSQQGTATAAAGRGFRVLRCLAVALWLLSSWRQDTNLDTDCSENEGCPALVASCKME